ncbi:MAG: MerR family transcriptional regulator [Lachnospiraceae bacterium]|nr:MerR family transcriptional regulator [Lachnospiraceae bacterium]
MSHYLISEASRLVDEESHVLRYWEEELALKIPRNDLGHRYYTDVQLEIFRTIKELKRQGYQLKEIKQCLEEMEREKAFAAEVREQNDPGEEQTDKPGEMWNEDSEGDSGQKDGNGPDDKIRLPLVLPPENHTGKMGEDASPYIAVAAAQQQEKMREFRKLMAEILVDAMESEFDRISDEISDQVSNRVIKEMNYLDREREEREEERFKELDLSIRSRQQKGRYRAEAAATITHGKGNRRRWKKRTYSIN